MHETLDVSNSSPVKKDQYYVYILLSLRDKKLYIGFTSNLRKRLIKHAKGEVPATKFRRPLRLIYYEYFINLSDAKVRERFLKSGFGRTQFKKMLKNTFHYFQ